MVFGDGRVSDEVMVDDTLVPADLSRCDDWDNVINFRVAMPRMMALTHHYHHLICNAYLKGPLEWKKRSNVTVGRSGIAAATL